MLSIRTPCICVLFVGKRSTSYYNIVYSLLPLQPPHGALIFESLYSYEAEDLKDLSFKKDEHFHIMKSTKENWWLARAITTGQIGFIPKNYVAQYDEALESHE